MKNEFPGNDIHFYDFLLLSLESAYNSALEMSLEQKIKYFKN